MAVAAPVLSAETHVEEKLRAEQYQLLATMLARPPDASLLHTLASLTGDGSDLGQAFAALADAARASDPVRAEREYHELFIGLGRGELVPYASYYLTGFLNEKPLAKLRVDMSRLGIARADEVKEPEDHIAALCEMMAGLIQGWFRPPLDLVGQRAFFDAHLRPWAPTFFEDLEGARNARVYRPIGTIGRVFMTIEQTAFDMA
jgi:TorA maturation chaperone TorD